MRQRKMGFWSDSVPSSHPEPMTPHPTALLGAWNFNEAFFVGNQLPGNGLEVGPPAGHSRYVTFLLAGAPKTSANGVPGLWVRIQKALGKGQPPPDSLGFF